MNNALSWYAVLRWYPDKIAGECVNVGIVAWGQGRALRCVLADWSRARAFDPQIPEPVYFEEWADRVTTMGAPDDVRRWADSDGNTMSCATLHGPMGSTLLVEELLSRMAARFLKEPAQAGTEG